MDIVQEELDRLSVKKRSPLKEEATSGKLQIQVVEAHLSRDTEAVGMMDPYVILTAGAQKF